MFTSNDAPNVMVVYAEAFLLFEVNEKGGAPLAQCELFYASFSGFQEIALLLPRKLQRVRLCELRTWRKCYPKAYVTPNGQAR